MFSKRDTYTLNSLKFKESSQSLIWWKCQKIIQKAGNMVGKGEMSDSFFCHSVFKFKRLVLQKCKMKGSFGKEVMDIKFFKRQWIYLGFDWLVHWLIEWMHYFKPFSKHFPYYISSFMDTLCFKITTLWLSNDMSIKCVMCTYIQLKFDVMSNQLGRNNSFRI